MRNEDWILESLVDFQHITEADVAEARAKAVGSDKDALGILIRDGKVNEAQVLQIKGAQFGAEVIKLSQTDIPKDVIGISPDFGIIAWGHRIVPVKKKHNTLTIAMEDPCDINIIDDLCHLLKCEIRIVVASKNDIETALKKYYPNDKAEGERHREEIEAIQAE